MARFPTGARWLAGGVVLLTVAWLSGCKTTDAVVTGAEVEFEFPFLNDYDVVNRTTFMWDDAYVTNRSDRYHQELAGPMSALAASTYGFRLFTDVRSLMDMGFPPERLERCYGKNLSYDHPVYGRDRVGYTIASRMSELPGEDFAVVIVALRGTFGRDEWLSNINLANEWGKTSDLDLEKMPALHEGFSKATDDVMGALAEYVKKYDIDLKKAKILITGHSRGASVANLMGKRLDDAAEGPRTSPFADVKRENIYVYGFAPPSVTIKPNKDVRLPKYNNIFSIINPEDLVPKVPFKAWNGARFGRELYLKSFNNIPLTGTWTHPGYVGMKNAFKRICGYEYYHVIGGTNLVDKIPVFALRICPSVRHFYWVVPGMRAEGKTSCTHQWLEMILWKTMASADDASRNLSLAGDVQAMADTYCRFTGLDDEPQKLDHRLRFFRRGDRKADEGFNPDGRDFSQQPGLFDVTWQFICMHAMQTYISWMKSGSSHGPGLIFTNWDDFEDDED